jgi:phosphodiesterase/alkaline phosphatase D-like protein
VTSGNTGSCSSAYLCNGIIGYDGPTGLGSISGDVIVGAPGVTRAHTTQSSRKIVLHGGVYTNQIASTVRWEYGSTSRYGRLTKPVSVSAGLGAASVIARLPRLASGQNYHYRMIAINAAGVSYGYDRTFTGP